MSGALVLRPPTQPPTRAVWRAPCPCPAPALCPLQCHTFLGTVTYMSPERINGEAYSFPADIWALGLTLLECATGKYPYDASGGTMQLMIQVGGWGAGAGAGGALCGGLELGRPLHARASEVPSCACVLLLLTHPCPCPNAADRS